MLTLTPDIVDDPLFEAAEMRAAGVSWDGAAHKLASIRKNSAAKLSKIPRSGKS